MEVDDMLEDLYRRAKRILSYPFTLLLVPPRGVKTKTISMPLWLALCVCLMLVVFLTGCAWSYYSAWRVSSDQEELARLRQVNQRQQQELLSLQQQAVEAKSYLEEVQGLDQSVRKKAGIENRSSSNSSSRSANTSPQTPSFIFWKNHSQEKSLSSTEVSRILSEVCRESVDARKTLETLESDLDAHYAYLAAFPDHWPLEGNITSTFGNRKSPFGGQRTEFHNGIDIAVAYGEPISAAGDGVVAFTGYRAGYGRTVVVFHSNSGYRTTYCHLSKSLVQQGERVTKGQTIALAGSSGRSTGPHLHFMVEKDGNLMDPLQVLKQDNL